MIATLPLLYTEYYEEIINDQIYYLIAITFSCWLHLHGN